MATRFIPVKDFICADRQGRRRMFKARNILPDGTQGYFPEDLHGLSRDHLSMFRELTVTGDDVVEQATAAPGEKRARKPTR